MKELSAVITAKTGPYHLPMSYVKILEKMIVQRLKEHIQDNDMLDNYRSGFRCSRSTIYHLMKLQGEILHSSSTYQLSILKKRLNNQR